jgi:hypothetical protein
MGQLKRLIKKEKTMKKTILYFAAVVSVASAFLTSCGSSDDLTADNNDLGKYNVTATGSLGSSTRVAFSDDDETGNITTSWEAGEQLLVYIDGNAVALNATTVSDKTATFTGQATSAPTSSSSWKAVTGVRAMIDGTNIICNYVGQDGTLASAQQYDYMVATATGTASPTFDFSAGKKLSYILRVKLPADVTAVELNAPKWTVTSSADPSNAGPTAMASLSPDDEIQTITLDVPTTADHNVRYFAVPALDYSKNGLRFTVFKGENSSAGKAAFVNLTSVGGKVGDIDLSSTLTFVTRPSESVDLGLSVKWGILNLGATTVQDYGNYYAWGETTTKTNYSTSTSKWYNVSKSDLQTKGVIDSEGNLTSAYDVATLNWGRNWRMPTKAELVELANCTHTQSHSDSGYGYVFSGTNGNSIFLPAAGWKENGRLADSGLCGYYWSSTVYDDNSNQHANCLNFLFVYNQDYGVTYKYLDYGFNVRPVTNK